ELSSVVSENMAWKYIRNSCDTTDPKAKAEYEFVISEIQPRLAPYDDSLNRKLLSCPFLEPFLKNLPENKRTAYEIYLRQIRKQVEIYREENIPIFTEISQEEQKYAETVGE